jgi:hypothetical protein
MNWLIRFPKKQLDRAKEKGMHLLAIGYHGGGRAEAFLYMSPDHVTLLWLMAHGICRGKAPAEALQEAEAEIAKNKAKAVESEVAS